MVLNDTVVKLFFMLSEHKEFCTNQGRIVLGWELQSRLLGGPSYGKVPGSVSESDCLHQHLSDKESANRIEMC